MNISKKELVKRVSAALDVDALYESLKVAKLLDPSKLLVGSNRLDSLIFRFVAPVKGSLIQLAKEQKSKPEKKLEIADAPSVTKIPEGNAKAQSRANAKAQSRAKDGN